MCQRDRDALLDVEAFSTRRLRGKRNDQLAAIVPDLTDEVRDWDVDRHRERGDDARPSVWFGL